MWGVELLGEVLTIMKIMKKQLKCKLCKSGNLVRVYNFNNRDILKCKNCNLIFTNFTKKTSLREIYTKEYFDERKEYFGGSRARFSKDLRLIKGYKDSGNLLDVGCGIGIFLDLAKKSGYEVYGLDVSDFAAKTAKAKFSVNVKVGELERTNPIKEKFDVITMFDYFEHVTDPNVVLGRSRSLLKDDGILLILTIEENALITKVARLMYKFGIKWPAERIHPIDHNNYFTQKTHKTF